MSADTKAKNTNLEHMPMKSQYSMGQLDFIRYHEILKQVDELGFNVGLERPHRFIRPYFSILEQLYINLQAIMTKEQTEKYDADFKRMEQQITENKITHTLIQDLKDMNKRLVRIKQAGGLGMSIQREYSDTEKERTIYGI